MRNLHAFLEEDATENEDHYYVMLFMSLFIYAKEGSADKAVARSLKLH